MRDFQSGYAKHRQALQAKRVDWFILNTAGCVLSNLEHIQASDNGSRRKPAEAPAPVKKEEIKPPSLFKQMLPIIIGSLVLLGVGSVAPASFMTHFTVFVLSCFIGYMVIWNVSASLHTPLMSVTNAVSSIIVIGALVQISSSDPVLVSLAAFGILITSINIVGGFAVTQRMLDMFRK